MTRRRRRVGEIITRAVIVESLVVAVVIGLAVAGLLLERSVASTERQDQQTLVDLENFEFQVLNAETGFRGYALARKAPFLAPYHEAFPAIEQLRPALLKSVGSANRPYMHEAFRVIADWRRNFAEPALADLRRRSGANGNALINSGEGKRRIDRIRLLVNNLRADELDDLQNARDQRERISQGLLVVLVLSVSVAILGGWRAAVVLRRAVVNPMSKLAVATTAISEGDLGARAEVRGALEVAQVGEAFNRMADRVEETVVGLREVDELKTRFLSTVSHELRTPLTSIAGYLQLLEQGVVGDLTPEQLGYVHVAQRNGDRLASLIDDLLMLSRFDAGRIDMKQERVDLSDQLRDLYESMEPVAEKGETRLEIDTPEHLVVEGDPRRLQQSFANLVSNAIKFNRAGGAVRISAAAENGSAVVEVSDEGVGIPEAELQRIGERFFRASTTTNLPGTGLGLAITREIIERHGGKLEVESEPGKGSSFRIRLPRDDPGHQVPL